MRIYFHLKGAHEVILDEEGVEVSGPQEARVQALLAIEELRDEKEGQGWSGWSLVAADDWGTVLFSLDLDSLF